MPGHRRHHVQNFSRLHQVVQRAHHLFDRCHPVPDVQPIEVDIIGLQPFQTRFERLTDILALVPSAVDIIRMQV